MKTLIKKLIQEIKAVVFEKGEMEYREMSELKAPLPLLDSNSDAEIIF